jgi:hypothetical protein
MLIESPLIALAILAVFTLLFHIALVHFWPLSSRGWKKADYWWLGMAALGLVTATGEVRRLRARADILIAEARADDALHQLKSSADPQRHCRRYKRSEYSPANFDSLQAQRGRLCTWVGTFVSELPDSFSSPAALIGLDSLLPDSTVTEPLLQNDVDEIVVRTIDMLSALDNWQTVLQRGERSGLEVTTMSLSPFLLALALGLRITKVTGELSLIRTSGNQSTRSEQ